ncbi:LysR family transcriptional regulator [Erythrobacter sp. GH1-10]|uniref:LysR family transcriptional regulator n=1 Tax=Erythrobacter sp. GH1-10 TaxID=3349334 RepID=UPI003877FD58
MTLDQIIAVEAVVATGTFRAAADRLNKAQSAVSHQVRKLEDELGFEIFSREAYRPVLTERGRAVYTQATRVLHHVRSLQATASGLRGEQEARVSISVTATMPIDLLLEPLKTVGELFPATHIRVYSDMMGGPLSRLMNNEADLIIASLAGVPIDEVDATPLGKITIQPVCSAQHHLASMEGVRSIAEMQNELQIVVADTVGGDFEQSRDVTPGGQGWTVSDFSTKRAVLLSVQGWGGMPLHLVRDDLSQGRLVALNVEGFPPRITELYAIRKRGKEIGQVQAEIWQRLIELDSTT